MKTVKLIFVVAILGGCAVTGNGVVVDLPNVPTLDICKNVATDADAELMSDKIKKEDYKADRLPTARLVTKDYCFVSSQVVTVIGGFTYEDNKLELAKELYEQTTDKQNYDLVVDSFTYKSNKDKLKEYIINHP